MFNRKRWYFVSYVFYCKDDSSPTFGQVEIITRGKIKNYRDIKDVQLFIRNDYLHGRMPIILNYKLIKNRKKVKVREEPIEKGVDEG